MSQVIKIAQKGVKDPNQMTLRERKKHWNRILYVKFKQELKQFKNVLNGKNPITGQPDPNRRIQHPFPPDVAARAEQVANLYNGLMQESNAIIQQQAEYSRTRRKGRKDMPPGQAPPQEPAQEPDLFVQMQAAAKADIEGLIKEASWWGSRQLFRFKSMLPLGEEKERADAKIRADLLRGAAVFEDKLQKFEDEMLTPGKLSVPRGFYALNSAMQFFIKLSGDFTKYLTNAGAIKSDKPAKREEPNSESAQVPAPTFMGAPTELREIQQDRDVISTFLSTISVAPDIDDIGKIESFKNAVKGSLLSPAKKDPFIGLESNPAKLQQIIQEHKNLVMMAKDIAKMPEAKSITDIVVAQSTQNVVALVSDSELQKFAYKTTSRMLKRMLLGLVSQLSEKDVIVMKAEIAKYTKSALSMLDRTMNLLEDRKIPPSEIADEFYEMSKDLYDLTKAVQILGKDYNERAQSENINNYDYKSRLRIISTTHLRYMVEYERKMVGFMAAFEAAQQDQKDQQSVIDPESVRDNLRELSESGSFNGI